MFTERRARERCCSDRSQANELHKTDLMFHVPLVQCCCCCCCTLLHNAPLFLSSLAQICPMQGGKGKKRSNISPPLKLNKSASRLLPQAARWSSAGFSAAVPRLFCAHKLGRPSESSCYSRNGLGFFFPSPLSVSFHPHSGTPPPAPCIDISYLPGEKKVPCLLLIRRRRDSAALFFYLLANGCHVYVHSFSISRCSKFPQGGFWLL